MFDVPMSERPSTCARRSRRCARRGTGEAFEHDGRSVRVTPATERDGGSAASRSVAAPAAAARRAARLADGFVPVAARRVGATIATRGSSSATPIPDHYFGVSVGNFHLADDVEARLGRGRSVLPARDERLRAVDGRRRHSTGCITSPTTSTTCVHRACIGCSRRTLLLAEIEAAGPFAFVLFHPMLGGIPPERWLGAASACSNTMCCRTARREEVGM